MPHENDDEYELLIGRPVTALKRWLAEADIKEGPVFRRIDQCGNIDRRALTPQSVNLILKNRCKQDSLDPTLFSVHGVQSGYLTKVTKPMRFRHSPRLVAAIAIADLRDIAAQRDQMRERPVRGGKKWQPSSVRDLLEAHRFGLTAADGRVYKATDGKVRFLTAVRWHRQDQQRQATGQCRQPGTRRRVLPVPARSPLPESS